MENLKDKLENILVGLQNYKIDSKCKGVVLGLSGGKDSTVVAMLAKKIFGDNVLALLMPNGEQKDISDSIAIAETLKIDYRIINIETVINNLKHNIEYILKSIKDGRDKDWFENCPPISDKAKTNIPPRIRMTTLYAVAQTLGYRVIGTGNKSEAYIGWTTKWGDSAYDFNPIANLTCTEVIEVGKILAKEFELDEKYIVKTPSDGLCGMSDEESFGFTYTQLDYVIKCNESGARINNDIISLDIVDKIERMHKYTNHKRRMPITF